MISSIDVFLFANLKRIFKYDRRGCSSNVSTTPFSPICPKPLFQSEVKCKAIDMKIIFFLSLCKFN